MLCNRRGDDLPEGGLREIRGILGESLCNSLRFYLAVS